MTISYGGVVPGGIHIPHGMSGVTSNPIAELNNCRIHVVLDNVNFI